MRAITGTGNRRKQSQVRCAKVMKSPALLRVECSHLWNICAADEDLLAGTAQDENPQVVARGKRRDCGDEFLHQRAVERPP
jgi:hypothetical protein